MAVEEKNRSPYVPTCMGMSAPIMTEGPHVYN